MAGQGYSTAPSGGGGKRGGERRGGVEGGGWAGRGGEKKNPHHSRSKSLWRFSEMTPAGTAGPRHLVRRRTSPGTAPAISNARTIALADGFARGASDPRERDSASPPHIRSTRPPRLLETVGVGLWPAQSSPTTKSCVSLAVDMITTLVSRESLRGTVVARMELTSVSPRGGRLD